MSLYTSIERMMNDDQRQNGGLRVVRQGLGAGTLSCRWCGEDMGPPTLAIEGKGETDASLRYHRCPSCGSLMSEGSADAFLQMRGNQDLVDLLIQRIQKAQYSIDACFMKLTEWDLRDALISAHIDSGIKCAGTCGQAISGGGARPRFSAPSISDPSLSLYWFSKFNHKP